MNGMEDYNYDQQNNNKKEIKVSKSTIIIAGILVVVIIIGIIVGMNMHAQSQRKDDQIRQYEEQQREYDNRSAGKKATDGASDIIDAFDSLFD